jgi:hypothetical protein
MQTIFNKKLPQIWVKAAVSPDDLRHQPVKIQLPGGLILDERLEIEDVNSKGEMLIRIDYNASQVGGRVVPDSMRVKQADLDALLKDRDTILRV